CGCFGLAEIERHVLRTNAVGTTKFVAKRYQLFFGARHQQNIAATRGELTGKDFANAAGCAGDEGCVHSLTTAFTAESFLMTKARKLANLQNTQLNNIRTTRSQAFQYSLRWRFIKIDARHSCFSALENYVLHLLNVDVFAF